MVITSIKQNYSEMFQAEKKVADYILEHTSQVLRMNISELAKASDTSDATVIRMCRRIGYSGFYQFKIALASSHIDERPPREIERPEDVVEYFEKVSVILSDVVKNIDMKVLKEIVDILSKAATVFTTAWGNSNEIAADMAHRLTRVGIRSFHSDMPEYLMRSLGLGNKNDVLVAVSHSGEALHVIEALKMASELGIKTILIVNAPNSSAKVYADYELCTGADDNFFDDFGGASHILELMVVDAILYFLKGNKNMVKKSDRAEFIISHYKL